MFVNNTPSIVSLGAPLIITGMHRSGTSAFGQMLLNAGVCLGDELLAADKSNPRGYFEDTGIMHLQDAAINELARDWRDWPRFKSLPLSEFALNATLVNETIKQRFAGAAVWGWKDPRTCLFLEWWAAYFPNALFLIAFRDPSEVVWSLLRRGDSDKAAARNGMAVAAFCRGIWKYYNERIVQFANLYPERVWLWHAPGDFREIASAHRLERWLANRGEVLKLTGVSTFESPLMSQRPPFRVRLMCGLDPSTRRTYRDLLRMWKRQQDKEVEL